MELVQGTLSLVEKTELEHYESVIERGRQVFLEVGESLMAIRDGRLYRETHATFEDYCRERWGMSRIHAHRLIEASEVVSGLLPMGNTLPTNERQIQPLTQLEPTEQRAAWREAVETAPNGVVTASHVQQVVDEMKQAPHVTYNSGNNEWYTPAQYVHAAKLVMGGIDLDPASSEIANKVVGAKVYYAAEQNGLDYKWAGKVWMNPPYSTELIGRFCKKLVGHIRDGDVPEAIVLVNNATDTAWFQELLTVTSALCLIRGRVRFLDRAGNGTGAPLQGQAILYAGDEPEAFTTVFAEFGGASLWMR